MTEDDRSQRSDLSGPVVLRPDADGRLSAITRRVVAWYSVVASAWIVGSDLVAGSMNGQAAGDRTADIAKGLLFVAVSAGALWLVLRHLLGSYDRHFARSVTAQRDFYQSILQTSSDAVVIFDETGTVRYVNDALTEILGWTPDEVVGRPGRAMLHADERASVDAFRENAIRGLRSRRTFRMLHRDGTHRTIEVSVASIELADGTPGAIVNGRDVTDRARGEQQLRAALAEDATGLPNLRMFVAEMERIGEIGGVGLDAVVALVDIDRFGDINALHGRVGGDAVLLELTRRLEATVPEAFGLWRHGADEILTVILEDPTGRSGSSIDLSELVERIQKEAAAPLALDDSGRRVSVQVSVGVVRTPVEPGSDGDTLGSRMLRSVERALADAKQHPDRGAVHVTGGRTSPSDRAVVIAQLRDALDRGELVPHFQPKLRLRDLRVVGVEALVRWQHPERGLLLPDEFLGAIGEANLMGALTHTVMAESLSRLRDWLSVPGTDTDFQVCVNITLDDLRRKHFATSILQALDASGVPARHLCLELTEQTMLADAHGASTVVAELRAEGIHVAIDDFGTGYSSLEHIRVFEVDSLKIDKGFVQRIGRDRTDEAIVDSIIAIADRLEVQVVAEGIEDVHALEYLRQRGCYGGQGYLFSPAVPAAQIEPDRVWEVPG